MLPDVVGYLAFGVNFLWISTWHGRLLILYMWIVTSDVDCYLSFEWFPYLKAVAVLYYFNIECSALVKKIYKNNFSKIYLCVLNKTIVINVYTVNQSSATVMLFLASWKPSVALKTYATSSRDCQNCQIFSYIIIQSNYSEELNNFGEIRVFDWIKLQVLGRVPN